MSNVEGRMKINDERDRPCFLLAALIGDLRPYPELDLDTLTHHLTQSDATAAEGYWHAAVNEARSFLEGLLDGILHAVCPDPPDKPSGNGAAYRKPLRCCRSSLLKAGFIDADKDELLKYVYGLASSKGCHPGVISEVWSLLARRMVFTAGQYMIQHYAAWKAAPGTPATPAAPGALSPVP